MAQWGIKYITGMNFPPEGNTLIPQRLASSLIDPYQTYGVTRPVGPLGRGLGSSSANPNDIHSIFCPCFCFTKHLLNHMVATILLRRHSREVRLLKISDSKTTPSNIPLLCLLPKQWML